uniref:Uncharacterized protein n=1 Tax=Arcella intermedia TaxID=1963864 RepID=A0A6B2LV47_9EUKA
MCRRWVFLLIWRLGRLILLIWRLVRLILCRRLGLLRWRLGLRLGFGFLCRRLALQLRRFGGLC